MRKLTEIDLKFLAWIDRKLNKTTPKKTKPTGRHRADGKSTMQLIRANQAAWGLR